MLGGRSSRGLTDKYLKPEQKILNLKNINLLKIMIQISILNQTQIKG